MRRKVSLTAVVAVMACVAGATAGIRAEAHHGAAPRPLYAHIRPAELTAGEHRSPAVAANTKKGVTVWPFSGVRKALARSGASWYYTWSSQHSGVVSPRGVRFVPMIWGAGSVTSATLRQARRNGPYLLGFNEPDSGGQSKMTVSQALGLWPKLMGTRMKLGSPAVATDAATAGGWLDRFMRGVSARHYRVNFIAVHWYGGDFATRQAVGELRSYLRAIHARYHRPIWLTEFALIRFGGTVTFPTPRLQAAFVTAAASMLEHLPFVQRYAWFALPATPGDASAGLFRPGAIATAAGRAFEKVDSRS